MTISKTRRLFAAMPALLMAISAWCAGEGDDKLRVNGTIQSDILFPQNDKSIGASTDGDWAKTNTYADLSATYRHLEAGVRVEYMLPPLPGFERQMKGWGTRHYYARLQYDKFDLTAGSYYEQFGSGFILRTYEERSLGVDNSLMGGRLILHPVKGVALKLVTGKQRRYWHFNDSWINGADLELNVDRWWRQASRPVYLTLGGSWVNKYEKDKGDISKLSTMDDGMVHKMRLNVPECVNAFDVRANLSVQDFNVLAEYAWKTDDPAFDKNYPYIYRKGTVAMLSTSYSHSGMSVLLQAKRSDNMSFRSDRNVSGTSSFINHLPAFTLDHTYALPALYPYATQPNGEWAFQAELGYKFKRGTALGGQYGTELKLNFSHVRGLERNAHERVDNTTMGTDGYGAAFWKMGERYYQDINVQLSKRFSKAFTLNLMYMNQHYNKTIVEGEGGMIHSNILVADGKYRFNRRFTLRGELQYLHTKQDDGDWLYGLLELSMLPHFMFTIADMYNSGQTDVHYYQGYVTYSQGAHRLQVGYGRTRAGYNCAGGVCRYVPASKGATISYNFNF